MARSFRHTPIMGITTATSEKDDKRIANGKLRAAVRDALRLEKEVMPELKEVSNIWTFSKDGKQWWEESLMWRWKGR